MSWILATVLMLAAGFIGAFILCEWIVRRRSRGDRGDGSPTG